MLDDKIFTFLKVAECKNYTRAAAELNLTQPAVTQQIKKLESHYGHKLVEFTGKTLGLTAQGHLLFDYARFQAANEMQLVNRMKKAAEPMRIGATLSIADYYLPAYLSRWVKEEEEALSVIVRNTRSILEMLMQNELSCAFIEGIFDKTLFHYKVFKTTRFLPVARKGHPLENRQATREEVDRYPLLLREEGSGTRRIHENYLYQHNDSLLSASKVHEIGSFGILKKMLADSDAVSFMYEEVARQEVEAGILCHLDVKDHAIERPLYFVYPRNNLVQSRNESFYRKLVASERT